MKKVLSLLLVFMLVMVGSVVAAQDDSEEDEMEGPLIGFWEECATPENLPETVTIGAVFALSGSAGVYGNSQQQAVELAVDEINEAGYLGEGTTFEVIFEDSAGDAEQAIAAMTSLVEEDGVVAVLGPTLSTEAFAADPIANENETVVMGVSNTAIGITDMGDYVFRNSLAEAAVIPGTIEQAVSVLEIESVGVVYGNDDDFTISGYEVFIEALEENGVEILGEETFGRGDVDFSAQLTNLINQEPDAIVASALAAEAIQIINQAREYGFTGPIIGGNGFNSPTVLSETADNNEGLIVGAAWNVQNPENNEASILFTEMFEEAYDILPDQFAAQAYTGAWLLATAARCGDSADRTDVRDALAVIQGFPSPLGEFSFDNNRDPLHDPVAQIVFEGEFAPLSVIAEMD